MTAAKQWSCLFDSLPPIHCVKVADSVSPTPAGDVTNVRYDQLKGIMN